MRKTRVLVIGMADVLGSHDCQPIAMNSNDVIYVNSLLTESKDNIRYPLSNLHFEFICNDVTQFMFAECERVYNLACPVSTKWYQKDPIYSFQTSVYGIIYRFSLAEKTGTRNILGSTSEIYGDQNIKYNLRPMEKCVHIRYLLIQ